LRDRAQSYSEPFQISITKFDGTTATITNMSGRGEGRSRYDQSVDAMVDAARTSACATQG